MAIFMFEIPDAEASRIATSVCASQGYGPSGPADATDFTKNYVFRHLASLVIEQEAAAAASAASDSVRGNASDPLAQALLTPAQPETITGPSGPDFGPFAPTAATS